MVKNGNVFLSSTVHVNMYTMYKVHVPVHVYTLYMYIECIEEVYIEDSPRREDTMYIVYIYTFYSIYNVLRT